MPLPKHEIDGLIYQIKQQVPLLQKYENHAILWFFDFYRPKDKWLVNTFWFHDRWQELFKANCNSHKAN
jgi:hypothetical protein